MKRKWLFASLLLTAALTMTSCSFKLPVELPFKIPFITADRNTKTTRIRLTRKKTLIR